MLAIIPKLLQTAIWALPASRVKNMLLRRFGHTIGKAVTIAPILVVGCKEFRLDDETIISPFNMFRGLRLVDLGKKTFIGRMNYISAAPAFQVRNPEAGTLRLGDMAVMTNRHYLDCSGKLVLAPYAAIGGTRSLFQTHEQDVVENKQTIGTIFIGSNTLTSTNCTVLKGAVIPEKSVIAAGSLLVAAKPQAPEQQSGLYAGRPAKWVRDLPDCKWWYRDSYFTPANEIDDL